MSLRKLHKSLVIGAKLFALSTFTLYLIIAGVAALYSINPVIGAVIATIAILLTLATITSIQH